MRSCSRDIVDNTPEVGSCTEICCAGCVSGTTGGELLHVVDNKFSDVVWLEQVLHLSVGYIYCFASGCKAASIDGSKSFRNLLTCNMNDSCYMKRVRLQD